MSGASGKSIGADSNFTVEDAVLVDLEETEDYIREMEDALIEKVETPRVTAPPLDSYRDKAGLVMWRHDWGTEKAIALLN